MQFLVLLLMLAVVVSEVIATDAFKKSEHAKGDSGAGRGNQGIDPAVFAQALANAAPQIRALAGTGEGGAGRGGNGRGDAGRGGTGRGVAGRGGHLHRG